MAGPLGALEERLQTVELPRQKLAPESAGALVASVVGELLGGARWPEYEAAAMTQLLKLQVGQNILASVVGQQLSQLQQEEISRHCLFTHLHFQHFRFHHGGAEKQCRPKAFKTFLGLGTFGGLNRTICEEAGVVVYDAECHEREKYLVKPSGQDGASCYSIVGLR